MRTTKVALLLALFSLAAHAETGDPGPPPPPPLVEAQPPKPGLEVPRFSKGGLVFAIEFGPGAWDWNTAVLADQLVAGGQLNAPSAAVVAGQWAGSFKTSYALSLRIGYNILGFASIEFAFAGTGWDLSSEARGGGGFAGGVVRFHPLEILWRALKKNDPRPFGLDFSTYWGWGYGIAGFGNNSLSPAYGTDGFAFQWGFDVEYFFTRGIGVSLGLRGAFPFWDGLYFDFGNRAGYRLGTPTRGSFWTPTIGVVMRAGD